MTSSAQDGLHAASEAGARPNVVRKARGTPARGRRSRRFHTALLAVAGLGAGAIGHAVRRGHAADAPVEVPDAAAAHGGPRAPGYVMGRPDAPVEIIEYADFECPVCAHFALTTEREVRRRLIATGRARYRFYDFQINVGHRNSPAASLAAACAADQGRFWPMHDRLFGHQLEWNSHATDEPRPVFARYAQADPGLDVAHWQQCYDAHQDLARLAAHRQEATRAQAQATPSFVIGHRLLRGPRPLDEITALVDSAASPGLVRPAPGAPPPSAR